MNKVLIFLALLPCSINDENDDYFDEDYDKNKNCKHQDLMIKLKKIPFKCSSSTAGLDEDQWNECKRNLKKQLLESCPNKEILSVRPKV